MANNSRRQAEKRSDWREAGTGHGKVIRHGDDGGTYNDKAGRIPATPTSVDVKRFETARRKAE